MRYLLDTNIVIAAIQQHPKVLSRLTQTPLSRIALSSVVLGELQFGATKSRHAAQNLANLQQCTEGMQMLDVDALSSACYAKIRHQLEAQGQMIGANDLWIAAQAVAHDCILVTHNRREFDRVDGLRCEDWLG